MKTDQYRIGKHEKIKLKNYDPRDSAGWSKGEESLQKMNATIEELRVHQEMLYAHNKYGLLIILQAMDAAGKDGIIKHVMAGLNPQGVQVKAFKTPSVEELDQDYLRRSQAWLPQRGNISIFNRSYYEEVLVVKVHNLIQSQNIPSSLADDTIWQRRYRQINDYERYLAENGIVVLKFFLNISAEEQKERLLARINNSAKHWKFSSGDIKERRFWKQYMEAYEEMLEQTSTEYAPWHIIPADRKWFARLLVAEIIDENLDQLPLEYPQLDSAGLAVLDECRRILEEEGGSESGKGAAAAKSEKKTVPDKK